MTHNRVLIVDDNVHFLEAARSLLIREGMSVVGVASSVNEALDQSNLHEPDVILVDVDLGEESGLDLARVLTADDQGMGRPTVILMSAYPAETLAELVDDSDAAGFIPKSELAAGPIQAIIDRRATSG